MAQQGTAQHGDALLTLNAGSSSLKVALFPVVARGGATGLPRAAWTATAEGLAATAAKSAQAKLKLRTADGVALHDTLLPTPTHGAALQALLAWHGAQAGARRIVAVGHRIVHGGTHFVAPVRLDDAQLHALQALEPLAPLHQPHNLAGVRAAMQAFAGVPQIGCFDTAFHATQPAVNRRFALPRRWHDAGLQRYGFHGLSYESIAAQLEAAAPAVARGRVVVAHLGNGASMCAMAHGRSVATTMSFSPLDGLTMGTRSGSLDAAAVLYLQRTHGMTPQQVEQLLFRESGLLGLSGLSADMRTLEAAGTPEAALAIEHFAEQVVQRLGQLAAALRGIDALVFTGGIGENAAGLRARVLRDAAWMGLRLDEDANARGGPCIGEAGAAVSAWVLRTDEEAVIAAHTRRVAGIDVRL